MTNAFSPDAVWTTGLILWNTVGNWRPTGVCLAFTGWPGDGALPLIYQIVFAGWIVIFAQHSQHRVLFCSKSVGWLSWERNDSPGRVSHSCLSRSVSRCSDCWHCQHGKPLASRSWQSHLAIQHSGDHLNKCYINQEILRSYLFVQACQDLHIIS